jgi:hypothetical protein
MPSGPVNSVTRIDRQESCDEAPRWGVGPTPEGTAIWGKDRGCSSAASGGPSWSTAHTELARRRQLQQRGVISRSELDGFQRTHDVAEAALREAQRALDDTRMVAPFDWRVARTLVNNFQNVQARQVVLIFQNNTTLEVDIQVPEADMSAAERGITARNARYLLEAKAEFPTIPNQQFDLELKSFSTEATALPARGSEHPPGHDLHSPAAAAEPAQRPARRRRGLSSARAGGFHGERKELSLEAGSRVNASQPRGGRNARCDR